MKYILKSKPIKKAHDEYRKFTSSDEYREIHESRMKWQRDQNTRIEVARREGEVQGKAEGEYARAVRAARVMLKKGYDTELICEVTGLSAEEIRELKE